MKRRSGRGRKTKLTRISPYKSLLCRQVVQLKKVGRIVSGMRKQLDRNYPQGSVKSGRFANDLITRLLSVMFWAVLALW